MWKVFEGTKAKRRYPSTHIIVRLGSFLIHEPEYFKLFCSILIKCKGKTRQQKMDIEIKRYEIAGKIEVCWSEIFRSMVEEFYTDENNKGKILEYILSELGPRSFHCAKDNCYNDCWIHNKEGGRISEKNFDVVFYNDFERIPDLEAEMIESKVDLHNYLFENPPSLKLPLDSDAISKLRFFEQVKDCLCESKISIVFATARYNVDAGQRALDEAGYGWVEIFSLNEIVAMIHSHNASTSREK